MQNQAGAGTLSSSLLHSLFKNKSDPLVTRYEIVSRYYFYYIRNLRVKEKGQKWGWEGGGGNVTITF